MENQSNQIEGLWIPIEILSNTNLTANEKLVLSIIKALDKGQGCFASNKYIAKLIGLESRSMTAIIGKLKEKGFVNVTVEGYNTRTIKYTYQLEKEPVEEVAVEEVAVEEVAVEEVPNNVIPMKKKPIMWRGIDLSTWDDEAIERLKLRYPEVVALLDGKKTIEEVEELPVVEQNFANSNADIVEVKSDIDDLSTQLKLTLNAN